MIELINVLESYGDHLIEYFWLPVVIWTLVAAPVLWGLYKYESLDPVYHYHIHTALLLVLPLGLLGTYLMDKIGSATESAAAGLAIIIQNPITVSGTATESTVWDAILTPHFWIGIINVILVGGALFLLLKLVVHFLRLRTIGNELNFTPLINEDKLMTILPNELEKYKNTKIAYSSNTTIPFTYGWLKTKIVLPADLKEDPESLAMAVQHELVHIKNHDFLLNSLLVLIKNIFWFHPLAHYLHRSREEYREILCDTEVLATNQFSKKKYASLLFKLAKRDHNQRLVLPMAVNPSSLKKRIQIISNLNPTTMNFRSSFLITLFAASLLTLTISCTDMADDNITKSDVEQTQEQMSTASENDLPLYIVNGEEWEQTEENQEKLSRVKSKYIESINVQKGEKAEDEYGEKGQNGVLHIQVLNPDQAFTDLKEEASSQPGSASKADDGDYYVSAEEMPELIGGLASLQEKINYPEQAHEAEAEGRVIVQFIVDKNGKVENPTVVKGVDKSLDEESLRVVKEAEFKPAKVNGEPVRVQYSLPITYQLPSDG